MSLILSIETSTPVCSVSLHNESGLLGSLNLKGEKSHATKLLKIIDLLLEVVGANKKDLSAIALAKGPGSYTGLRIGTSTAKGLCVGLDLPLIAVNTLEAMAAQLSLEWGAGYLFCPMIDARRMEVYCAIYNAEGEAVMPTHAKVVEGGAFQELLDKHKIVFFGNGAPKCAPILKQHNNAIVLNEVVEFSKGVGLLAIERFKTAEFEDVAYFDPYYLKEFKAIKPKKLI